MAVPAVEVVGLRKVFRRGRRQPPVVAVERVDLRVEEGEVVGLLGPNGAGKTTTTKCVATLVRPTEGQIRLRGVDAVGDRRAAVRQVSALLEGNRNVYWRLTVRENIAYFAGLQGLSASSQKAYGDELVERFRLVDKADTPARQLSKGMQQKLAVCAALARRTPVVLLDEPTLGLDVETTHELRGQVRALVAEEGRTVVLSSHDLDVVEAVADRVVVVGRGRVLADAPTAQLVGAARRVTYDVRLVGPVPEGLGDAIPGARVDPGLDGDRAWAVEAVVDEAAGELDGLLVAARASGAQVRQVERRGADLESVFLDLVGRRAAD